MNATGIMYNKNKYLWEHLYPTTQDTLYSVILPPKIFHWKKWIKKTVTQSPTCVRDLENRKRKKWNSEEILWSITQTLKLSGKFWRFNGVLTIKMVYIPQFFLEEPKSNFLKIWLQLKTLHIGHKNHYFSSYHSC